MSKINKAPCDHFTFADDYKSVIYCLKCNCILIRTSNNEENNNTYQDKGYDSSVNSQFSGNAFEIHPLIMYENMLHDSTSQKTRHQAINSSQRN